MDTITLTKQIEHKFEPNEVARLFCSMGEKEMAIFFNTIAGIVENEWDVPFSFQLAAVDKCGVLDKDGRDIMLTIGEFAS